MNTTSPRPITDNNGNPFRYYCNTLTGVAHASRRCGGLGTGTAGSAIIRLTNPEGFDACAKCVPTKAL